MSEEAGVRYLHFGSHWIQGAMRIARPWSLELEYTREMMFPLLLDPGADWPRTVLVIGLGAASLPKFLYRHRPDARVTVVEIEPRVIAAARQFFKLPDDGTRLAVEVQDGSAWLDGDGPRYDWIMVDGFDARGRPGPLDTLAFYARCRARLTPRGVLTVNLLGRSRGARASVERLREAFDGRVLALPPSPGGNVVVLASVAVPRAWRAAELRDDVASLRRATGLNLAATLSRLIEASRGTHGRIVL